MTPTGRETCAIVHIVLIYISIFPRGGGYTPRKIGLGYAAHFPKPQNPKTLTLFMTKICNFPFPFYDLKK